MASAVPYAKTNLLAIVAAAVPGTDASWGYPGQLISKEHVWIDDAVFGDTGERPSIHQVSHREVFELPVVVAVFADGDDHKAAELRAWELTTPIEAAIRAAPSLNAAQGVTAAYVTGKTPEGHIADAGRAVTITVTVHVESRI